MLEEIITTFLSLFSALTLDKANISIQLNRNACSSEECNLIHGEDVMFEQHSLPVQVEYFGPRNEVLNKPTYRQSLLRTLKATVTMTLAVLPLALMALAFLYWDLRVTDLCSEWVSRNHTLPFRVTRIRLIGRGVFLLLGYIWFPLTLVVLFSWREFKRHYSTVVLVGQLAGLFATLYLCFLVLYGAYDTYIYTFKNYRIPFLITAAVVHVLECVMVVRIIRQNQPTVSYSSRHIFTVVAFPLFSCLAMAHCYKYAVVPFFNTLDKDLYKFLVAILTPTLALIPTALCQHMALWRSSEFIEPGRCFGLVYFIRAPFICLYRIMQADFKNIWLFVGLSVLSGVSSVLKVATSTIRMKVWAKVIRFLNKICCIKLQQLPGSTPRRRRLKADTEIQNTLFENCSLILSQSFILLYTITNFKLSDWAEVKSSLIRICIGLSIELAFNFVFTFICIHWRDIPISRVWSKVWRRHMFATAIGVAALIGFFTNPLLTIFEKRFENIARNYIVRNCTLPYESWH